jgi:hypothetical protein
MIRTFGATTVLLFVVTMPLLPASGFAQPKATQPQAPVPPSAKRSPSDPIRSVRTPSARDASPSKRSPSHSEAGPQESDPFLLPTTPAPRCTKHAVLVVQRVGGYRKSPHGLERVWGAPEWRCLRVGERFGPRSLSVEDQPELAFTVRRKLDAKTLEVAFGKGWVVAGEPIAYPSKQNPKRVSTNGECFRMTIFDGGGDLCLRVVAASPSTGKK